MTFRWLSRPPSPSPFRASRAVCSVLCSVTLMIPPWLGWVLLVVLVFQSCFHSSVVRSHVIVHPHDGAGNTNPHSATSIDVDVGVDSPRVQLDVFGPHSIRVRMAPSTATIVDAEVRALLSSAPSLSHTSYPTPHITTRQTHGGVATSLTNGNLRVDVDVNGFITATRVSDGNVLLKQTSVTFGTPIIQGGGVLPSSISGVITFAGTVGESIYGLGEHRNGKTDKKINQMGLNRDTRDSQYYPTSHGGDVMIPYYSSSKGYGFLFNTASHFNVSITEQSISWGMHAAANLDFWITTTSSTPTTQQSYLVELLNHYAQVVGYASPMPYYVTGFWQCKLRYRSQQEILSVARGYVDHGLPISLIVVDYFHWKYFGDWSFNPTCWPNVGDMVTELKNMGIEMAVSFWPFVAAHSSHYDEFMVNHTYVWTDRNSNGTKPLAVETWADPTGMFLVDQTEPAVRQAFFDAFWQGYGQYGIRTLWLDAAEPERVNDYNYGDFSTISHGTDIEMGMAWTRFHAQSIHDGFISRGYTTNDFFTLSRSTWSGATQYSNAFWSGDTDSTFDELYRQIRIGQSVALAGQILWTTDIGGFCCGDHNDPVFQELIVRWMQFGAFCPLFRLHGNRQHGPPENECGTSGGDNEIWNLARDQIHYDAMVTVMRLREQLRPYVASINLQATKTGLPMIRPLFLEFPGDPDVYAHDGTYMFGDVWLVSPVTTYNQTSTSIYLPMLPSSQQWVYWYHQERTYEGGQHIQLDTPISEFPLFYRQNKDVKD